MNFRLSIAVFVLAFAGLPLVAHAASCNVAGACTLRYSGGRWTAVDERSQNTDLRAPSSETSRLVIDGARNRGEAVIDGSRSVAEYHVDESVMWSRSSDGQDEEWTRASHAKPHSGGEERR